MAHYILDYFLPDDSLLAICEDAANHPGPLSPHPPGGILWDSGKIAFTGGPRSHTGRVQVCNGTHSLVYEIGLLPATVHFIVEGEGQINPDWDRTLEALNEGCDIRFLQTPSHFVQSKFSLIKREIAMKYEAQKIERMAELLGWKETMLGWGTWKGSHATTYAPTEWNPWFRACDLAQVFDQVPVAEIVLRITKKTEGFDLMDMATIAKLVVNSPKLFADAALAILEQEHPSKINCEDNNDKS